MNALSQIRIDIASVCLGCVGQYLLGFRNFHVSCFPDFADLLIQDFPSSGFHDSWILDLRDFLDFWISLLRDFRMSGFPDFWISIFLDFMISGSARARSRITHSQPKVVFPISHSAKCSSSFHKYRATTFVHTPSPAF